MKSTPYNLVILFFLFLQVINAQEQELQVFAFGTEKTSNSDVAIATGIPYQAQYGFDYNTAKEVAFEENAFTSNSPVYFSTNLPEGNYRIKVILGSDQKDSETTVKAESRRLMLREVPLDRGQTKTLHFSVNLRTPKIADDQYINLKSREVNMLNWDNKLTLEFSGEVAVRSIHISPVDSITSLYLAGDSTVTDQGLEPWASWGQMITQFFTPNLVVANYAASGESLSSFQGRRRLKKILSLIKPGDYVLIEFGHNDQKEKGEGKGPWQSYTQSLTQYVNKVRAKGAIALLATPIQRRHFEKDGRLKETHGDYPAAMRKVAEDLNVPLIDLTHSSTLMYETWGDELSTKAFVHYPANTFPGQEEELKDNTHFNSFGANEIALAVVTGIKNLEIGLKKHLNKEVPTYDPANPQHPSSWTVPMSPKYESTKPDGN